MADPDYYPSIRETFHILLTMPMGSVKKHMNTLIFCFEASKAMEQNNNGRGLALLHIHRQGQCTRQKWGSALVNYFADIYGIMYRDKHFKYGF